MIFIKNDACAKSVLQIQSLSLGEGSCLKEMVLRKWKTALEIVNGKNQKDVTSSEGTFPIYGSGGVIGRATDFLCPAGTTIVGRKGTINRPIYVNDPFWNVDTAFGLVPGNELNSKYLYYFCCGFNFTKLDNSTTIPSLSKSVLLEIEMPLPPLTEQERIVARIEELFSDLDKGVEVLQTIKAQLKVYRQAVLKEAFEPKSGWVLKTSAEIGEVNLGRQRSPKNVSNNYPTKYIRAANITEQGLNLSDLLEMEFTPSERQKYTLVQGDIVLSEASGSIRQVGKPAIWKNEIEGCCFQNTVIRHRVNGANPQYVFWYYKYCYVSGLFSKIVGGVGINHIGAKNFSELVVPLAPRGEQSRIVTEIESRLSVCDKIEQTVDESLAKAESLRQSILKKAFEGRL